MANDFFEYNSTAIRFYQLVYIVCDASTIIHRIASRLEDQTYALIPNILKLVPILMIFGSFPSFIELVSISFSGVLSNESDFLNWSVYWALRVFNILAVLAVLVLIAFFVGTQHHLLTYDKLKNLLLVSIMGEKQGNKMKVTNALRRWTVTLEKTVDCPICLIEMEAGSEAVALPCSSQHVYHETCVMSLHDNKFLKCALCRAPIKF